MALSRAEQFGPSVHLLQLFDNNTVALNCLMRASSMIHMSRAACSEDERARFALDEAASLGAFYYAQINRGRVERLPQEGFVGIGQHKAHTGQRARLRLLRRCDLYPAAGSAKTTPA